MSKDSITTVSATGTAIGDYDTVIMSVNAFAVATTSVEAKQTVQETVRLIDQAVAELKEVHGVPIEPGCLVSTYDVDPWTEYRNQQNVHVGYRVTYGLQFRTSAVDKASVMQDVLTSVPDVIVAAPDFRVKDPEALKREALKDAWKKVWQRLRDQCAIIGATPRTESGKDRCDCDNCDCDGSDCDYCDCGDDEVESEFDPDDFGIVDWKVDYERRGGFVKAEALSARPASAGGDGPIQVESGKARIEVVLTVSFEA